MRQRGQLLRAEVQPDEYGQQQRNWIQHGQPRWASIKAMRPAVAFQAAQHQTSETHTIRCAWSNDPPTSQHRWQFGGRVFDITRVIDPYEGTPHQGMVHECWAVERSDGTEAPE